MSLVETKSKRTWNLSVEGQGEVLLFIHGWAVDSRIWLQQRQFFAPEYQVVSIDLPGHGQTPWQELSLEEIAEDFWEVLSLRKREGVRVVGSSFGGLVALKMCELDPQRFRSLTLVGSCPKFLQSPDYPWGLSLERIAKLKEQLDSNYPSIVPIFFRSLFTPRERESERFKWLQSFRKNDNVPAQEALLKLLEVLSAADLRPVLRKITAPVQFINGTEDNICPRPLYDRLKQDLPQARFDWIKECGHFPFVSRPADFNPLLKIFFDVVDE